MEGIDFVVDGMDNFETRFLINDAALESNTPWVYGGCIGSHGQTMTIIPGETACLRCLIDSVPGPGATETCDTAGVLGAIVNVVGSLEAVAAIQFLSGHREAIDPMLTVIDVWDGTLRKMSLVGLRERTACPACQQGEREWLSGNKGSQSTFLCGRNAVQISPAERTPLSLPELATRLNGVGTVSYNPCLLKLKVGEFELTVFPDARAIIKGTQEISVARGLYARYVGV
jgi:adenylyltransferase/sulfurtransferase